MNLIAKKNSSAWDSHSPTIAFLAYPFLSFLRLTFWGRLYSAWHHKCRNCILFVLLGSTQVSETRATSYACKKCVLLQAHRKGGFPPLFLYVGVETPCLNEAGVSARTTNSTEKTSAPLKNVQAAKAVQLQTWNGFLTFEDKSNCRAGKPLHCARQFCRRSLVHGPFMVIHWYL